MAAQSTDVARREPDDVAKVVVDCSRVERGPAVAVAADDDDDVDDGDCGRRFFGDWTDR